MKNRGIAVLLAFFLGGLGFHRFYLGQVGRGFLMMLFCWTFIPMIIGFLDAVRYAAMSDETFHRRYDFRPQ